MFRLFGNSNKKKDTQVKISSQVATNQVVQDATVYTDAKFTKPPYNPQTRRSYYDDSASHKAAKENAFSGGGTVRDPYTNAQLVLTVEEAKRRYGDNWQSHLAEADHIDPLNQVARRAENNPWVTAEDVKNVGNSQDNFQVISRRANQTGGKGGSTQTEWSQDDERMRQISEQTGEPIEVVADRIRQTGEIAERRNNVKLAQASVKNMATTAHMTGMNAAANAGGTAATISGIYNVVSCINGEKTVKEALKDTREDTSKVVIAAYRDAAGLAVINHTLTSSKSELLAALGKNNVAGKTITAVSVAGGTVVKWGNGEISTEECLYTLGDKGCSLCGAYYGRTAGMVIGSSICPGLGSVVGGAVGSLIGGTLTSGVYNSIIQGMQSSTEEERLRQQKIYEAMMRYYAEQQRRKEVQELIRTNTEKAALYSVQSIIQGSEFQSLISEAGAYFINRSESERRIAECILVTLQLREYNRQLQEYVNNYFAGYEYCFNSALDIMDSCLRMGDYDGAIKGVNQITRMFGRTPIIENTEDFKKKFFGNDDIIF